MVSEFATKIKGAVKFGGGIAIMATTPLYYPAAFTIGWACIVAGGAVAIAGKLTQTPQIERGDTPPKAGFATFARKLGAAVFTFGAACIASPAIGAYITAEGGYNLATGKDFSPGFNAIEVARSMFDRAAGTERNLLQKRFEGAGYVGQHTNVKNYSVVTPDSSPKVSKDKDNGINVS